MNNDKLDTVGKLQRNDVACIHSHGDQPGCNTARQSIELTVGAAALLPAGDVERSYRELVGMRLNGKVQIIEYGKVPPQTSRLHSREAGMILRCVDDHGLQHKNAGCG